MTQDFADVSVIMPAYKAAATIGRALTSIARQSLKPREVVVVDDGCPQNSGAVAQAMAGAMDGIELRVLHQPNSGPGAARNLALGHARCTWIAFLDADDEWMEDKIRRSMWHLAQDDLVLVAHDGWEGAGGVETPLEGSTRFPVDGRDPFIALYRKGYIDTCSVVCRRDAVLAVGGFDPTLPVGQDFDLFLAMLASPQARFLVFGEKLVRYYITPGSVTSNRWRRLHCQMRILRRHAPALAGRDSRPVLSVLYRVLAVHYEAIQAFRQQRRWRDVLGVAVHLPWGLLTGLRAGDRRQAPLQPDQGQGRNGHDQQIL